MRSFVALVWKELLVLARDRHGLAVLFVMPAIFILIMSLALRDALDPGRRGTLTYLWLDQDGGYFALTIGDSLAARPTLERGAAVTSAAELQQRIREGAAPFGVHIAPGLDGRIAAAGDPAARAALVTVFLSPSAPPQARELFLAHVRAALAHVQAEHLLEDQMGVPHEDAQRLREQTDPARLPLDEAYVGTGDEAARAPNAVQQSVPAWLVFAMFFVVLPIATSVLAEREQGNLQRLTLLNVAPLTLLAAKFPAYYLVNLVQLALMLAVGVHVVPLLGGDALALGERPEALLVVASALSVAAIGFALLIAVVARSTVQATVLGGIANLILGAIGGVMVPKLVMPPLMQTVALASPMSWALEGCWDILLRNGGAHDVLPEAGALILFGLACYALAAALFPRGDA